MDYEARRKEFNTKLEALLAEFGFKFQPVISFKQYNILPVDLQLALKIIEKHEGKFDINLIDQKTEIKKE